MKKQLLLFIFLITSSFLFAQTTTQLEAKLRKAGSDQERIEISIDLAKAYMSKDGAKSARYAQDAYDIARRKKYTSQMAEIAYLSGEIYLKRRDGRKAEARFKRALSDAKTAKNNPLVSKSLDALAKVSASNGNHKQAYAYANQSIAFLKKNGGGSSSSTTTRPSTSSSSSGASKSQSEVTRIVNDNRQLVKDKQSLQQEVDALKADLQKYGSDNAKFSKEAKDFDKQSKEYKESKEKIEAKIKNKEKEIKNLTEAEKESKLILMERESALADLEKDRKEIEMENERNSNFLKLMGLGTVFLIITSLLFFGRLRANRKAKRELEEKNKLIEEERQRSEELLLNILPESIAKELKENGKAKAQKYERTTVLFTDFKNFSRIAEKLSPEDLVAELDHCFKAFDYIISQYDDIEKIKTIGDAYMCASGLNNKKSLPHNIVKAALEMQDFLKDYKIDRSQKGMPYFEARIGLHTGAVVAGVVGFNKFAYDIWGDTVNIAARMEANGEVGRVNISESTHTQVKYQFDCQYRGKIAAKNKGQIDMYYVNRPMSAAKPA